MKRKKLKTLLLTALLCAAPLCIPVRAEDSETDSTRTISNAASSLSSSLNSSLTSDYAFAIDIDTHQVLVDKGSTEQMYPASMTKVLTVLTVLDHDAVLTDTVTITDEMLEGLTEANASVVGYTAGDVLTVQDLLYGAIMPSGADACNALAFYTAGSVDAFVEMMNEEAADIGMSHSHFMNPTGLHDDNHYMTCQDMALLVETALQNDTFRSVYTAYSYTDSLGNSLINGVRSLLTNYPEYSITGLQGCKSGYTDEAGHTLSSYEVINGMNIVIVTAHADTGIYEPAHVIDTAAIASFIEENYTREEVVSEGDELAAYTADMIVSSEERTVAASEDVTIDVPKDADITVSTDIPSSFTVTSQDLDETATITVCADKLSLYTCTQDYTVKKADDFLNCFIGVLYDRIALPLSSILRL